MHRNETTDYSYSYVQHIFLNEYIHNECIQRIIIFRRNSTKRVKIRSNIRHLVKKISWNKIEFFVSVSNNMHKYDLIRDISRRFLFCF